MLRAVLDTNILVSALFWEGNERDLLRSCQMGDVVSITSPGILRELVQVLVHKFNVPGKRARGYVKEIVLFSELVFPMGMIDVMEHDPADNMVLETAILGRADMIVTGDGHLLGLRRFRNVEIRRTREALML